MLHDNATSHTTWLTKGKISESGWDGLKHPTYSLDLAPNDFHRFRALEYFLLEKHVDNVEEMRLSLTQLFDFKGQKFTVVESTSYQEKLEQVINIDGESFDE